MENQTFTSIAKNMNLSAMGNDLNKGDIAEAFMYGSDKIKISKTGKQIKESIKPKKDLYEVKALSEYTRLTQLQTSIPKGIIPTEDCPEYWTKGYSTKINPPKRYSWDSCKSCVVSNESSDSMIPIDSYTEKEVSYDKAEASICSQYNDTLRKYVECKVEVCMIQTITDGLLDKKVYDLSLSQAAVLGF